ncbi:MAG: acyl-CoA/acyl-ACP dehydrogenase [Dehalococcoidia bacterium]|nr:acyl-CoA/acyl-ACP dehydrogenase [Dehalococcoidia bacterium]
MLHPNDVTEVALRAGERERVDPEAYPVETMRELHECGLIAAPFAEADGGSGWSCLDAARAIEGLARQSPSAALIAAMPLGFAGVTSAIGAVVPAASEADWRDQVDLITSDFRAHRHYAACNSEAGAGGSLDATKTVATRTADGGWRLSGAKILATGGAHADVFFSTGKVTQEDLPGAGVVEEFLVRTDAPGVTIASDWDGFGMRSTESQSVRYEDAEAIRMWGYPNLIAHSQAFGYWYLLFAAVPLGAAWGIYDLMSTPAPSSPAMRLRLSEARMRLEALSAYLHESAREWRPAAGAGYVGRVLRTKTHVSAEATKLCAELFALSGGRQYRRGGPAARLLADAFAGTALRPPLALALDQLVDQFED